MSYLDGLNDAQKEAVLSKDGPLLIVAGAGAGKTKAITHRIAHLIASGVAAEHILAITFTNKAAREMKERVEKLLGNEGALHFGTMPTIATFHSLGVRMLREKGESVGIKRNFSILDDDDSLSAIKKAMRDLAFDPKEYDHKKIRYAISRKKANLVTPEQFLAESSTGFFHKLVGRIWQAYERELGNSNALDFDDLILKNVTMLKKSPETLAFYHDKYTYILIDEYQDTNLAQFELSRILADKHKNICAVGDADQAIYGWREADYRNVLNFEKHFPGAKVVLLEKNYRSTGNILGAANSLIENNKERKDKRLYTDKAEGDKISLHMCIDGIDEARYVASTCKELLGSGLDGRDIAVLYRANFQSRLIEEQFLNKGLPYHLTGTAFFERKEVKDVLSYIKLALNPNDSISFMRVVNVPRRGLGDVTVQKIMSGNRADLPAKTLDKVISFENSVQRMREAMTTLNPSALIKFVLKESGLGNELASGDSEDADRLQNIMELASVATKYDGFSPEEGINLFLEEAALYSDQDSISHNEKGVRLMTVHAAKGLEFDTVLVIGLEEDLFPSTRGEELASDKLEEERRLFYVAITRAKRKLYLSHAAMRMIYGSTKPCAPSRFIDEINEKHLEVSGSSFRPRDPYEHVDIPADDDLPTIEWACLRKSK